jgi:hypothetical protein
LAEKLIGKIPKPATGLSPIVDNCTYVDRSDVDEHDEGDKDEKEKNNKVRGEYQMKITGLELVVVVDNGSELRDDSS